MKHFLITLLCFFLLLTGCEDKKQISTQVNTATNDQIQITLEELEDYRFFYDETLEYLYLYQGDQIKAICSFLNIEDFSEVKQSIEQESQEEETFFTIIDQGEKDGNEYYFLKIDPQSDEYSLNLHYLIALKDSHTYIDMMFTGTVDTIPQAEEIIDALMFEIIEHK